MENDVLRTEETLKRYKEKRRNPGFNIGEFDLLSLPHVKEWEHWVLVDNEFPYDRIADRHCLLVSRYPIKESLDLFDEEREELEDIKKEFAGSKEFDGILENMEHNRTVPKQYHLHLIKFKYRTPLSEFEGA